MKSKITFIHALSPLHAGTGQGIGVIDLPIAREKATNLPYLPGSTLKGSLRDELADDKLREEIFGPDAKSITDENAKSGSIVFTDQKLLFLPVRSLLGIFAWVTSPYILERFKRDCAGAPEVPEIRKEEGREFCLVSDEAQIKHQDTKVVLEDLDLFVQNNLQTTDGWVQFLAGKIFPKDDKWQTFFRERFCIVSDDVMNFLSETATEVIARNVLSDETKTSENLWYEESLPTETILSGLLVQIKENDQYLKALKDITKSAIQLGGSMTVGRGLCQMIIEGGENANS